MTFHPQRGVNIFPAFSHSHNNTKLENIPPFHRKAGATQRAYRIRSESRTFGFILGKRTRVNIVNNSGAYCA